MSQQAVILAGRYALETPVARGGMATVWQAQDEVLARRVAVKVLHPHLADDEAFLERFRREALAAARLTHPNIVSIYDSGSEPSEDQGELHYIVMEYCGKGTLAESLGNQGTLPPDRTIGVGSSICEALDYAHSNDVVHRDVKPANVLIADDGTLKVADFGIAKAAFSVNDITTTGLILGTVTYLSPEQAQGAEPDARSDLYGLGVVLYESLVGRPPFIADSPLAVAMKHINEEPPPLRSIKAGIPRPLEAVVLKGLAKDPADRFGSAAEMRGALEEAGGGPSSTTSVMRSASRAQPQHAPDSSSGDWRPILLVVALIAAAVIGAVALSSIDRDEGPGGSGNGGPGSNGEGTSQSLQVDEVSDFDPHEGSEHPEETGLAIDGDDSTAWSTETYNDPLQLIGKPGVGLLFDLGDSNSVDTVEVKATPGIDLELRSSSEQPQSEEDMGVIDTGEGISGTTTFQVDGAEGRYWLVWITSLPGGGAGSAQIYEVTFDGG